MKKPLVQLIQASCIAAIGSFYMPNSIAAESAAEMNPHHHSAHELAPHLEAKDRDSWQLPEQVMNLMGELKGKTVLDIGAGTGYFSFKLAQKGAHVIAADVDPAFITMIEHKKQTLNIASSALVTKLIPFDSPELAPESVDTVLTVDTYHHISDRVKYFAKVHAGLTKDGRLTILDYKLDPKITDGPSMAMRVSPEVVVKELKQAGFSKVKINNELLSKQYIIQAIK